MGAERLVALLSWALALFGPTDCRGDGGGLSTTLSPGLMCWGLESKFGWGPGPLDRRVMGWSCLCLGYKRACVLGYPCWAHWFTNCRVIRYDLFTIWHRSKNWKMKDGKMVLIAYHLLENSTGSYIEWLVNELMMTTNEIKYKDARLVMLPADAINPQAR